MNALPILIADSGSTKTDWCLLSSGTEKHIHTQGISPYFLTGMQITEILKKELLPALGKKERIGEIFYYGTGCKDAKNAAIVRKALKEVFPQSEPQVTHDLLGAARALCGRDKGVACILGTGSGACYYNGKKVAKSNPGLGYILGDEGSGAYLGKKVVQYYLYGMFDDILKDHFDQKFGVDRNEILERVYKSPLANRYLASFSPFLSENRGHFMIENILEDGLNDFFFQHITKYNESWKLPVHFVGGIAWWYRDVISAICSMYELQLGRILKKPMDGLIEFHRPEK